MSITSYGNHPDQVIEHFGGSGLQVVLIHGGYWRVDKDREHMRPLAEALVQSGFKVSSIEYRRVPGSPELAFEDAKSALGTFAKIDALIGFSVGGQIAAVNSDVAHNVILLAPVTDLNRSRAEKLGENAVDDFFGDVDFSKWDPMQLNYRSHLLLIHGDQDPRVPIQHSRDFAKAKQVPLLEVLGGDHMAMIEPETLAYDLILQSLSLSK